MKRFSITLENAVVVLGDKEANAPGSTVFHSEPELRIVTEPWPMSRLVEVWNGLGVNRVRKFKDRATAVSRIWNEIQDRKAPTGKAAGKRSKKAAVTAAEDSIAEPAIEPAGAEHAREEAVDAEATGEVVAGTEAAAIEAVPAETTSKKDRILALLREAEGATLSRMMAATGWQKHSVRGFLSGAVHKKMGLTVLSTKAKDGERVYRLKQ